MKKLILPVFLFLFLSGCNRSTEYAGLMNQAYELMDSKPDSAAAILNRIDAPGELPPPVKADYGYLKSLAYYKTGKSMIEDSLILFTFDYYKKNNNTGRLKGQSEK